MQQPAVAAADLAPAQLMPLWFELVQFYYREARCLDDEDYDAWFDMLSDDLDYWMPARENLFRKDEQPDDPRRMNFYHETKESLGMRVSRLRTGTAWSENPATRYRHLVTNVEIDAATDDAIHARSNFIVYRNRLEREEFWLVGKREDVLMRDAGTLQLAKRKITLDQNVLLSKNLNVYL